MKMSQELQEKQLLSLFFLYFTRPHPRLHVTTRTRVCVWWGVKEESSRSPVPNLLAFVAMVGPCRRRYAALACSPASRQDATRGHTVAHDAGANVAGDEAASPQSVGTWRKFDHPIGPREQRPC